MTPAELDRRVDRVIACLFEATDPALVPGWWAREVHSRALRWALQRVDPDSERATVFLGALGRLGLVVEG